MSIRSRVDFERQQQDRLANHRSRLNSNRSERLSYLQMIDNIIRCQEITLERVLKQSNKGFLDRFFKREHISRDELYQFHSCTVIKLTAALRMIYDLDPSIKDKLKSKGTLWDVSEIIQKYSSILDPHDKTLFIKDLIISIRSIDLLSI